LSESVVRVLHGSTESCALLGHLWLHEPSGEDVDRAVVELGLPRADPLDLAQAYADLFLLNVFPYGSAFTDPDGELNGAEADIAAAAFETFGFDPKELLEVAAADHLGLCLNAMRFVTDAADGVEARGREFIHRLTGWAPVCCLAVEREPAVHPFYSALAARTRELVLQRALWPPDSEVPSPFSDGDGSAAAGAGALGAEGEVALSDILGFLLVPARCGIFLSRARLGRMALELGLRLPFGTRHDVARSLFTAAGESENVPRLLDVLAAELVAWEKEYRAWHARWPGWGGSAARWLKGTGAALQVTDSLRDSAKTMMT
jgi:TorA maturation chaperone TorD